MKIFYKGNLYKSSHIRLVESEEDDYISLYDELENNPDLIRPSKEQISELFTKWANKGLDYDVNNNSVIIINNYDGKGTNGFFINGSIDSDINSIANEIISLSPTYRKYFPNLYSHIENINKEFWNNPSKLYHATDCDNIESILEEGLNTGSGTGLGNKSSSGVFTNTSKEGYIDSYGDCVIEIDTNRMLADGFTPEIEQEPEILEYEILGALNHILGNNEDIDLRGDIDYDTIIVTEPIPAKYLRLIKK